MVWEALSSGYLLVIITHFWEYTMQPEMFVQHSCDYSDYTAAKTLYTTWHLYRDASEKVAIVFTCPDIEYIRFPPKMCMIFLLCMYKELNKKLYIVYIYSFITWAISRKCQKLEIFLAIKGPLTDCIIIQPTSIG